MAGNPVDAEDISQEVFLKVYRSFGTFRKGAKLGSWLYRITYNASIDHLRRKGAAPEAMADELIESSAGSDAGLPRRGAADPAADLESRQLQDRIARALDKVSPQEKAVFVLRHYDDLAAQGHRPVPRAVRRVRQELSFPGRPQAPEGARDDGPHLRAETSHE